MILKVKTKLYTVKRLNVDPAQFLTTNGKWQVGQYLVT